MKREQAREMGYAVSEGSTPQNDHGHAALGPHSPLPPFSDFLLFLPRSQLLALSMRQWRIKGEDPAATPAMSAKELLGFSLMKCAPPATATAAPLPSVHRLAALAPVCLRPTAWRALRPCLLCAVRSPPETVLLSDGKELKAKGQKRCPPMQKTLDEARRSLALPISCARREPAFQILSIPSPR